MGSVEISFVARSLIQSLCSVVKLPRAHSHSVVEFGCTTGCASAHFTATWQVCGNTAATMEDFVYMLNSRENKVWATIRGCITRKPTSICNKIMECLSNWHGMRTLMATPWRAWLYILLCTKNYGIYICAYDQPPLQA